jgi:hypothetical protein
VYDGAMGGQTDAGRLAHRMIGATRECMREWARDGSDARDVSVGWVEKAIADLGVSAEDAQEAAPIAIAYCVERMDAKAAAAAAEREEREAAERTAAAAATPRQIRYIESLTAHPEVVDMVRAGLTKRAASALIEDILAGEIG